MLETSASFSLHSGNLTISNFFETKFKCLTSPPTKHQTKFLSKLTIPIYPAVASYQEMGFFFLDWINNSHLPNSDTLFFGKDGMGWDGITFLSGWGGYIIESGI